MGKLLIVATPIGNLEDITLRALRVLKEASIVLVEDTRRTQKLLARHHIKRNLVSFHKHNEASREERVMLALEAGKDVALVSDAGVPLVSDPGERLVENVSRAGFSVEVIPGPSAVLTALVGSGLPVVPFTFVGFLPRKTGGRTQLLSSLVGRNETLVFFESPKRALSTLEEMSDIFGKNRRCVAARELTKVHEEFIRGTLGSLLEQFAKRHPKGELTLVVEGNSQDAHQSVMYLDAAIHEALAKGISAKDASRDISVALGIPKGIVYKEFLIKSRSELE